MAVVVVVASIVSICTIIIGKSVFNGGDILLSGVPQPVRALPCLRKVLCLQVGSLLFQGCSFLNVGVASWALLYLVSMLV